MPGEGLGSQAKVMVLAAAGIAVAPSRRSNSRNGLISFIIMGWLSDFAVREDRCRLAFLYVFEFVVSAGSYEKHFSNNSSLMVKIEYK